MKRAMKSAPLIGQIDPVRRSAACRNPVFLGAPGRIRTCAPASGGWLINRSVPKWGAMAAFGPSAGSGFRCDARRFIARTIARATVAVGLWSAGSGCGWSEGNDEFGAQGSGDAPQHRMRRPTMTLPAPLASLPGSRYGSCTCTLSTVSGVLVIEPRLRSSSPSSARARGG